MVEVEKIIPSTVLSILLRYKKTFLYCSSNLGTPTLAISGFRSDIAFIHRAHSRRNCQSGMMWALSDSPSLNDVGLN